MFPLDNVWFQVGKNLPTATRKLTRALQEKFKWISGRSQVPEFLCLAFVPVPDFSSRPCLPNGGQLKGKRDLFLLPPDASHLSTSPAIFFFPIFQRMWLIFVCYFSSCPVSVRELVSVAVIKIRLPM